MSTLAVRRGGGSDGTFRSIHSSRSYALTWMIILCLLACSIRMATHREARALNPRRAVRSRSRGPGTAGRRRAACSAHNPSSMQSPAIPLRPQQQRHADARAHSIARYRTSHTRLHSARPGRAGRLFIAPSPTTLSRTSGPAHRRPQPT
jgi:hypothetical protein